jgi:hypothetical protein
MGPCIRSDGDQLGDRLRIEAGVAQGNGTSERVGDDGHRGHLGLKQELGDVVDVVQLVVAAADHPLRVTMSAQIRRDDVIVVSERLRDPVPVPAVIPTTVDEQHGRRIFEIGV